MGRLVEYLPQRLLGPGQYYFLPGGNSDSTPVHVKIQHRHRRLKRCSLAAATVFGRMFQRPGNAPRIIQLEYAGFQIECIAAMGDSCRPIANRLFCGFFCHLVAFEKMHLTFMTSGGFRRAKRSQIPARAGFRIAPARVKPVFARFKLSDHNFLTGSSRARSFSPSSRQAGFSLRTNGLPAGRRTLGSLSVPGRRPGLTRNRKG